MDAEWDAGRMLREAREAGEFGKGRGRKIPDVGGFSEQQLHRWQDMSRVDRGDIDDYYRAVKRQSPQGIADFQDHDSATGGCYLLPVDLGNALEEQSRART